MDPVTHVASGLLLSQLIPAPSRGWAALAGVILAVLPDSDYFLGLSSRWAYLRYHRAFTHSLLAVPLWALLAAGAGRVLGGPRWFQPLLLLGLAALTTHLILDLATSYGTQVFSPFSRRKYTLDWLFIIDPYFTFILLAGALVALYSPGWGRRAGTVCLAGAMVYLLICGFYHHQALSLARQVFQKEAQAGAAVAALPQPLSCRRWQLIAARPGEIKQALVLLPYGAWPQVDGGIKKVQPAVAAASCPRAPAGDYRPLESLVVQDWRGAPAPLPRYGPEAQRLLDQYLDFARFPLLARAGPQGDGLLLEWVDLRFTVPGRFFPFVLQMYLDAEGNLLQGQIGRCMEGKVELRSRS
ncbi:MAG: metal-dependent hydrolase [Deltaproteobacteria bacterium]|nr:metal-dependent hydrolase [Deltaproteobacteria bacterium]MBI4796491.1 metal-dependent hydrolase [Deltaproteobacteria bacterium]